MKVVSSAFSVDVYAKSGKVMFIQPGILGLAWILKSVAVQNHGSNVIMFTSKNHVNTMASE